MALTILLYDKKCISSVNKQQTN